MNPILPFLITKIINDTTTNHSHNENNLNQKPSVENIEYNDVYNNSVYEMSKNKNKKEDDKEFFKNFKIIAYGIGFTIFIIAMLISDITLKIKPYQDPVSIAEIVIYKLQIAQLVTLGVLIAFIIIFALMSIIKRLKIKNKKVWLWT